MKNGCLPTAIGITLIVVAGLVVLLGGAVTFSMPRIYYASTRVVAERGEAAKTTAGTPPRDDSRSLFRMDQVEILRSQMIGYRVVEKEQLIAKWAIGGPESMAKEFAFQNLHRRLKVLPVRGSNVIEVGFYSTDPVEAADLANAITEAYRDLMTHEPHNYRVMIIEQARPPTAPAQPNVPLYLLSSFGVAGLFVLGGGSLIVWGQKQKKTQPPVLRHSESANKPPDLGQGGY